MHEKQQHTDPHVFENYNLPQKRYSLWNGLSLANKPISLPFIYPFSGLKK